jgi:hypothetical protein
VPGGCASAAGSAARIVVASVTAAVVSLQLGLLAVGCQTVASGISSLPSKSFLLEEGLPSPSGSSGWRRPCWDVDAGAEGARATLVMTPAFIVAVLSFNRYAVAAVLPFSAFRALVAATGLYPLCVAPGLRAAPRLSGRHAGAALRHLPYPPWRVGGGRRRQLGWQVHAAATA